MKAAKEDDEKHADQRIEELKKEHEDALVKVMCPPSVCTVSTEVEVGEDVADVDDEASSDQETAPLA